MSSNFLFNIKWLNDLFGGAAMSLVIVMLIVLCLNDLFGGAAMSMTLRDCDVRNFRPQLVVQLVVQCGFSTAVWSTHASGPGRCLRPICNLFALARFFWLLKFGNYCHLQSFQNQVMLKRCLDDFYSLSGLPELLIWPSNWAVKQTNLNQLNLLLQCAINQADRATQQHDGGYAVAATSSTMWWRLGYAVVRWQRRRFWWRKAGLLLRTSDHFIKPATTFICWDWQPPWASSWWDSLSWTHPYGIQFCSTSSVTTSSWVAWINIVKICCFDVISSELLKLFYFLCIKFKACSEERRQRTRFRRSWTFNDTTTSRRQWQWHNDLMVTRPSWKKLCRRRWSCCHCRFYFEVSR